MDNAIRSIRIGIAAKLAVYLVLGTGAVFFTFGLWNVRVHRAHAEALVAEHAAGIGEVIQRSTRYDMLRNDREALRQIIADIGNEPGIRRVRIYNSKGVVSYGSDGAGAADEVGPICRCRNRSAAAWCRAAMEPAIWIRCGPSGISRAAPARPVTSIRRPSGILGTIDTHLSLAEVDREIGAQQRQLWKFTILGLLFTGALSVAFVYLVLYRKISELRYGIKRLSHGDLKHRLPVRSADELGRVGRLVQQHGRPSWTRPGRS